MKRLLTTLSVLLLCLPMLIQPTVGRADTEQIRVHNERDLVLSFPNDCNGEIVDIADHRVFDIFQVTNPNGGFHLQFRVTDFGTGVGRTTGATYRFNAVSLATFNGTAGEITTQFRDVVMVGQGQTPNLVIKEVVHIVVNPNGEITADVDTLRIDCH